MTWSWPWAAAWWATLPVLPLPFICAALIDVYKRQANGLGTGPETLEIQLDIRVFPGVEVQGHAGTAELADDGGHRCTCLLYTSFMLIMSFITVNLIGFDDSCYEETAVAAQDAAE